MALCWGLCRGASDSERTGSGETRAKRRWGETSGKIWRRRSNVERRRKMMNTDIEERKKENHRLALVWRVVLHHSPTHSTRMTS
jgi:hypothetical protein